MTQEDNMSTLNNDIIDMSDAAFMEAYFGVIDYNNLKVTKKGDSLCTSLGTLIDICTHDDGEDNNHIKSWEL
jgi:hypothetical protein